MPVTMDNIPFVPFDPTRVPPRRKNGRPAGESQQASYAFHLYAMLGPGRTYRKAVDILVAEGRLKPGSESMVRHWGARYNWYERAKSYDAAIIEKHRERLETRRLERLESRAEDAADTFDQAVERIALILKDPARRVPLEHLQMLLKTVADIEHRDRETLHGKPDSGPAAQGISITIDTYQEAPRQLVDDERGRGGGRAFVTPAPTVLQLSDAQTLEGQVTELPPDDTDTPTPGEQE